MSEKTNKKETEELISDINKSNKGVEGTDIILSINRTEPTEGCPTKLKLFKNSYKPDKDV